MILPADPHSQSCLCRAPSLTPTGNRPQVLESNRTVVAAVRDEGKARDVLPSSERLVLRSGVDVTDPSTFSDDLWEGVTQVVSAVGPTFSRTEQGPKYALSLVNMHFGY